MRKIKSHRYQFKVQITTLHKEIQFCMSYKSSIVNTHTLRKEELCIVGVALQFPATICSMYLGYVRHPVKSSTVTSRNLLAETLFDLNLLTTTIKG